MEEAVGTPEPACWTRRRDGALFAYRALPARRASARALAGTKLKLKCSSIMKTKTMIAASLLVTSLLVGCRAPPHAQGPWAFTVYHPLAGSSLEDVNGELARRSAEGWAVASLYSPAAGQLPIFIFQRPAAKVPLRPEWEYRLSDCLELSSLRMSEELNRYGADGWAVATTPSVGVNQSRYILLQRQPR